MISAPDGQVEELGGDPGVEQITDPKTCFAIHQPQVVVGVVKDELGGAMVEPGTQRLEAAGSDWVNDDGLLRCR